MLNLSKKIFLKEGLTKSRARLAISPDSVEDIFSIGDIHGRIDLLVQAERKILSAPSGSDRTRLVIYLGDYVDRGPDSRAVIQHLLSPLPEPFRRICLCGNHDDAFHQFVTSLTFKGTWLSFGGDATLRSYGIDSNYLMKISPNGAQLKKRVATELPETHLAFLREAPVSLLVGDYLFVHAGIVPGVPLERQSDADLMWIREPFLSKGPLMDLTVVHGHTPSVDVVFGNNRIGIDTGAYMTSKLSILHIQNGTASVIR